MRRAGWMVAAGVAAGLLAGCDQVKGMFVSKEPAGPAAATVDGDKITEAQIDVELTAAGVKDIKDPKVRQAALQQIVVRKLMAKEAKAEKLDDTPQANVLREAALESFDAGLVQRSLVEKTPAPTRADAERYMQEHPTMFGSRTLYLVDQIQVPAMPDQTVAKDLQAANTIAEVEAALKAHNIPYRRGVGQLDSLRLPPQIAAQVAKVPPGTPFVLPAQPGIAINVVRESKTQPVAGDAAMTLAQQALTAERRQKAVADKVQALLAAKKDKITYADGYTPPPKTGG